MANDPSPSVIKPPYDHPYLHREEWLAPLSRQELRAFAYDFFLRFSAFFRHQPEGDLEPGITIEFNAKMKHRLGSASLFERKIKLNFLYFSKKPAILPYTLFHKLVHLWLYDCEYDPGHTHRFYRKMLEFLKTGLPVDPQVHIHKRLSSEAPFMYMCKSCGQRWHVNDHKVSKMYCDHCYSHLKIQQRPSLAHARDPKSGAYRFLLTTKRSRLVQMLLGFFLFSIPLWAGSTQLNWSEPSVLSQSMTNLKVVSSDNLHEYALDPSQFKVEQKKYCDDLTKRFSEIGWREAPCGDVPWQAAYKSNESRPLLYATFGDGEETTLVMSAVHPDEMTPVPMGFRFAKFLQANPSVVSKGNKVIVLPLVNPDGFFRSHPTRTNANGVDCNRNFFTIDWYAKSKLMWQSGRKRSLPHFPGYFPNSEIETFFQIQMIEAFQPDKILSIHAPLGFLDYDGPGDRKPKQMTQVDEQARQLVHAISKKTDNYRVVDYSFYPGSLGNYAGNERKIPTVTLELQTTDAGKVDSYWEKFLPGLVQLIDYRFVGAKVVKTGNASQFFKETLRYSKDHTARK